MNKIEVKVLDEGSMHPAGTTLFLARLTQRGHVINCMDDLVELYEKSTKADFSEVYHKAIIQSINALPHGTIKRFSPITIAIVGASRRFLSQARTHQVGMNYVSASLQYSDYSGAADFVVPYEVMEADHNARQESHIFEAEHKLAPSSIESLVDTYLDSCSEAMHTYRELAEECGNDAAGYAAPQGLRNILIIQGNHESWSHFIRTRACNRNTTETQYVTMKIWEALLETQDGKDLFAKVGPDCVYGECREGNMRCKKSLSNLKATTVSEAIKMKWPLLRGGSNENT